MSETDKPIKVALQSLNIHFYGHKVGGTLSFKIEDNYHPETITIPEEEAAQLYSDFFDRAQELYQKHKLTMAQTALSRPAALPAPSKYKQVALTAPDVVDGEILAPATPRRKTEEEDMHAEVVRTSPDRATFDRDLDDEIPF